MNINNPRIDSRNGYYNHNDWLGGPYLIIFNPINKNRFKIIINNTKPTTYNIYSKYDSIPIQDCVICSNGELIKNYEFIGKI